MPNKNLHQAKSAKQDEFYTQLADIENELKHYKDHFKGKVVYCNCDDPWVSNFFHYFSHGFERLGLKKLIMTCYKNSNSNLLSQNNPEQAIYLEYEGGKNNNRATKPEEIGIKHLKGDGDFRSLECIELLKQADIIVTNPPFSLFREYVTQLFEYNKKFLIIGNMNAIIYKEIFPFFKNDEIWLGYNPRSMQFKVGHAKNREHRLKSINACWFTNLNHKKRHKDLILYKKYNSEHYPKYDNYNAIHISKTAEIPIDYAGAMGVPITFLDKYNPEQFEILGEMVTTKIHAFNYGYPYVNGKKHYARIIIKNKRL